MPIMVSKLPYRECIGDDLIQKSLAAVLKLHSAEAVVKDESGKKSVFADVVSTNSDSKHTLNLEIMSFKVPMSQSMSRNRPLHPKINRFPLPHSLTDGKTSVLLIAKDTKKSTPAVSNAHYLEMLTNANCNHLITEIMSLHQLKTEYSEVEARLDLCTRTDVVLCDKALVKIVPRIIGRPFLKAKKHPMGIDFGKSNLLKQVTSILSHTGHKMTYRNSQSSLPFGRVRQTEEQLQDNMAAALEYLCSDKFPGGWCNVKSLYLTLGLKSRVPLYVSKGQSYDVPNIVIKESVPDVIEGDFGFGNVKITARGSIIEYKPHVDDEEPRTQKKRKLSKSQKREKVAKKNKAKKAKMEYVKVEKTDEETKQKVEEARKLKKETIAKKIKKGNKKIKKASKIHMTPVEDGIMDWK